jgi:glycosyltransferase involved in cell wall biosynthesis
MTNEARKPEPGTQHSRDGAETHLDPFGLRHSSFFRHSSFGHSSFPESFPRISVVTSSFNQGRFIARTIESVLAQGYPDVEHVVVDGMSTDETECVLARYPQLRVVREPDGGQAEAINKGFRLATGDILCFLNSDDTFADGALARVAQEIDPKRGRHVVMGRCRFIDEEDRFVGREHPWAFAGHRRLLEVWKGYTVPQPSVFWTRQVWERCGPLDEGEPLVLDYDLFCRMSRYYRFHPVDQVFANYRLHGDSKTCIEGDDRVLTESLRVSRRYWGPWWSPKRWRLELGHALFRLNRRGRALQLWRWGRQRRIEGRRLAALLDLIAAALLGPDLMIDLAILPALAERAPDFYEWLGLARRYRRPPHPFAEAWRDFTGIHADSWTGPRLELPVEVGPGDNVLEVEGGTDVGHLPAALELELELGGRTLGRFRVGRRKAFRLEVPIGDAPRGRQLLVARANASVTHHDVRGGGDFRPLSYRLDAVRLAG